MAGDSPAQSGTNFPHTTTSYKRGNGSLVPEYIEIDDGYYISGDTLVVWAEFFWTLTWVGEMHIRIKGPKGTGEGTIEGEFVIGRGTVRVEDVYIRKGTSKDPPMAQLDSNVREPQFACFGGRMPMTRTNRGSQARPAASGAARIGGTNEMLRRE